MGPSKKEFEGDKPVKYQALAIAGMLKQLKMSGKESHPAPAVRAHDTASTSVYERVSCMIVISTP